MCCNDRMHESEGYCCLNGQEFAGMYNENVHVCCKGGKQSFNKLSKKCCEDDTPKICGQYCCKNGNGTNIGECNTQEGCCVGETRSDGKFCCPIGLVQKDVVNPEVRSSYSYPSYDFACCKKDDVACFTTVPNSYRYACCPSLGSDIENKKISCSVGKVYIDGIGENESRCYYDGSSKPYFKYLNSNYYKR